MVKQNGPWAASAAVVVVLAAGCNPCDPGFRQEDGVCVDVDECAAGSDNCADGVGCRNIEGSFACGACPEGTADTAGDGSVCGSPVVCSDWASARADLSEGDWTGDVPSCTPGSMAASARTRSLAQLNLMRSWAGLAQIETDPERDADSQACALLMEANGALSNGPNEGWDCYSEQGADAAGISNLSAVGAVGAILEQMSDADPGQFERLTRRSLLLDPALGPIGIGSTGSYTCIGVLQSTNQGTAEWTAWPPPGEVPWGLWSQGLDDAGWSLHSDDIDLTEAQVTVRARNEERPVAQRALSGGFATRYAIAWQPDGWETEPGITYQVDVVTPQRTISYEVSVVDCAVP